MNDLNDFTLIEKIQFHLMTNLSLFFGILGFRFSKYLGKLIAFFMWHLLTKRRKLAIRNIKLSFNMSSKKAKKIAKKSFEHTARAFLEMNLLKKYAKDPSRVTIHIANQSLYQRFIQTQDAIIGTTAHFGAWELLSGLMGSIFPSPRKRLIIVRQYSNRAIHAFIESCREANGCKMIGHRRVTFNVIRALKEKGVSAFLVDHHTDHHEALRLNFLGRSAYVAMGPAVLAVRGEAMIFPVFLERHINKSNVYTFHVLEPLDTRNLKSITREDKVKEVAEFYTKAVEEIVTQFPEQWFWMHNRWKGN